MYTRVCHLHNLRLLLPPLCCVDVLVNSFVGVRKDFVGHEESIPFVVQKALALAYF